MKRFRGVVALLAVAGLALGCDREDDDALSEADVSAIEAVVKGFTDAMVAGDIDRVMAQRTPDIVWMPPGGLLVDGQEAVRGMAGLGPRPFAFTTQSEHTEGHGDLAYNRGSFLWSGVVGKDTVRSNGRYLVILRRQPDNTWKYAAEMWTENEQNPTP